MKIKDDGNSLVSLDFAITQPTQHHTGEDQKGRKGAYTFGAVWYKGGGK